MSPENCRTQLAADAGPAAFCPEALYEAACRYVAAGLSVLPVAADGSKVPDFRRLPRSWDQAEQRWRSTWKIYQSRRPQEDELRAWWAAGGPFGLAAVAGGGRGCGLEVIDFDTAELYPLWADAAERRAIDLRWRLVQPRPPGPDGWSRCSSAAPASSVSRPSYSFRRAAWGQVHNLGAA